MARSKKKAIFIAEGVLRALKRHEKNTKNPIKIYSRASTITPGFIGKNVQIYNGMKWIPVLIGDIHVGYKFGEMAPTRTFVKHAGTKATAKKAAGKK